jgi:hypothetical protein
MFIDFNQIARLGKLIALLGFLLPWVTVSCSGNVILEATGLQLMTGDPQPAGMLEGADRSQMDDPEPAIGVILACVAAALGLGLSFVLKGKQAAGAILAGAVLTIGLSYYSLESLRTEMTREASEQEDDMARAVANAIRIEKQEGFWVTVGGAGVGGVLALIVLVGAGGVRRPDETASPS